MGCTIHVTLHETTWDVNTMFMIYEGKAKSSWTLSIKSKVYMLFL